MGLDSNSVNTGDNRGKRASVSRLASAGITRQYRANTVLINQGDRSGDLFIIIDGSVRAYVEGPSGRTLTICDYQAGDYVGEMSLDGGPRSASVITTSPTTCSIVSQDRLSEHIRQNPDFAMDMIKRLIQRTRNATESARTLALLDVYGRVKNLLDSLSVEDPDGNRIIEDRMTQREMADMVGASREMISKVLKDLTYGGYIEVERKTIRILRQLPDRW